MRRARQTRYALTAVKMAFSDPALINRTMSAVEGAEDLGMDDYVVVEVIRGLTARDFDKSMPSDINLTVWQDVYKPVVEGRELYVKFTLDS